MSNKPAPRGPGCGKEMELMELERNTWRYSCEDCGWRSPAVHGPGKEGKDVAYAKAMKRYAENPWISVRDELPKEEGKYIVCTERGSVYCTRFYKGGGCEGIFKTDTNTHITYWMPLPEPPKEDIKNERFD